MHACVSQQSLSSLSAVSIRSFSALTQFCLSSILALSLSAFSLSALSQLSTLKYFKCQSKKGDTLEKLICLYNPIIDPSKSPRVTHRKEPLWLCRRSKCTLWVRKWSQRIPVGPDGERFNVTSNQRQLSLSLTNRKPGQSRDSPRGQSSHRGQRWQRGRQSACCYALPRWRQ